MFRFLSGPEPDLPLQWEGLYPPGHHLVVHFILIASGYKGLLNMHSTDLWSSLPRKSQLWWSICRVNLI